jgi:hypothetical protein
MEEMEEAENNFKRLQRFFSAVHDVHHRDGGEADRRRRDSASPLLSSSAHDLPRHRQGETALHMAVSSGHVDTVRKLLERGAAVKYIRSPFALPSSSFSHHDTTRPTTRHATRGQRCCSILGPQGTPREVAVKHNAQDIVNVLDGTHFITLFIIHYYLYYYYLFIYKCWCHHLARIIITFLFYFRNYILYFQIFGSIS